MAKSFAIPNNQGNYVNQTAKGNNGKAGSIHIQKRVSDFDNTLVSNTVDFTHLGSSGSNILAVGPQPTIGPSSGQGTGNS